VNDDDDDARREALDAMGASKHWHLVLGIAFGVLLNALTHLASTRVNHGSDGGALASVLANATTPLSRRVQPVRARVLCWIPSKDAHGEALEAVWTTWAAHCDKLIFTSAQANKSRNVVALQLPPLGTERGLWNIVVPGWRHIYKHVDEFDWFVKADDDTYFSGDNFKHLVRSLDPDAPHYLGHTAVRVHRSVFEDNADAGHGSTT